MKQTKKHIPQNQDKWRYNAPNTGGISMQPNNGKTPHQMLGPNQHPLYQQNHLNHTVLNPTLNQPVMIQSGFDHVHPSVNVNGVKPNEQLVYFGQPHSGVMQQHQYANARNAVAVSPISFLNSFINFDLTGLRLSFSCN